MWIHSDNATMSTVKIFTCHYNVSSFKNLSLRVTGLEFLL